MTTALYPWHLAAWTQLMQMRERFPHAILLHGPVGIGKTEFAEQLVLSLLCEAPLTDGSACGTCVSCGWVKQYSHPDYRRIRPEILELDNPDNEEDGDAKDTKASKTTKAPSKEILINQVRAISDFLTTSTHRNGKRVILLYPAEAMNSASSNALLKSLEEPGANTIFILVTHSIDALLPTILSRCHQFALTLPTQEQALTWLTQQKVALPEQFLAEQGGAPLAALAASQSEFLAQQNDFLQFLQRPDSEQALKMADKMQKIPMPLIITWMQRWLYDIFSFKLSGQGRYYPRCNAALINLAAHISLPAILQLQSSITQRRRVAEHPLAPKLAIEDMLLDYVQKVA